MIVRTQILGAESNNVCRAVIDMPIASFRKKLELVRTKLPRLPFRFARSAQVMVDGLTLSLPDTYSLTHLATVMSILKNVIGATVMSCYYANNEFEICVEDDDVTLHADFAAILNVPEILAAGECYSSAVEEEVVGEADYYRIVVEGIAIASFYDGKAFTNVVEEYRPGESLSGLSFTPLVSTRRFVLFTQVVKKDATVVDLVLGDEETACYWVKVF